MALGSIPVGGVAGVLSGGDMRTAYGIWVPAMGGTWFLTNGHLDGSKQLQFFGADYEDTPTPALRGDDNVIEDVPYRDRSGRYREIPGEDAGESRAVPLSVHCPLAIAGQRGRRVPSAPER